MKTENNSEYKNTNMDPAQATYTEKPKTLFKTLNRILKYSKKYGIAVIIGLIASIIGTILMLAGPSKLSELTDIIKDGLSTSIDMDKILKIAIILIVFYSLHWIFNSIQGWIMATVTQKISYEMRKDISVKINKVPMSYFSKVPTGDILSRVTNDVDTIGSSLNNSLGTMVSSIVLLLGSLLMMFITNWLLAVTAVLSSLIGFVLMLYIMSKSQKYFGIQQKCYRRN